MYGSVGVVVNGESTVCKMMNGVNVKMLSRITGNSCHEEATEITRSFDLVSRIGARRLLVKWVGYIQYWYSG